MFFLKARFYLSLTEKYYYKHSCITTLEQNKFVCRNLKCFLTVFFSFKTTYYVTLQKYLQLSKNNNVF